MSVSGITVGAGVSFGHGIRVGAASSGGCSSSCGAITYSQMNPPIIPGNQLEDGSATILGSTGFTINCSRNTGVAVCGLTSPNITYYSGLGTGSYTAHLGSGSSSATVPVDIANAPGSGNNNLVFFFSGAVGYYPLTVHYPITIR